MSKEKLKNRGITLIALIITIIVMLILTGVTLSITLGDNGLVNKAKEASTQTQVAMDRELLLSAVVGAIGNDGKVNLSEIVLPEGFTGSNGTYTSKNGNAFTVNENGEITVAGESYIEEDTKQGILVGKYYDLYGYGYCTAEITADDYMTIYEGEDEFGFPIIIDYEKETITSNIADSEEPDEISLSYDLVIENNKVVNVVVYDLLMTGEEDILFSKNTNGFEYNLDGEYYNESQDKRLVFDKENKTVHLEYKQGDNTWGCTSCDGPQPYFVFNGILYSIGIGGYRVSNDLSTLTGEYGTTYIK